MSVRGARTERVWDWGLRRVRRSEGEERRSEIIASETSSIYGSCPGVVNHLFQYRFPFL